MRADKRPIVQSRPLRHGQFVAFPVQAMRQKFGGKLEPPSFNRGSLADRDATRHVAEQIARFDVRNGSELSQPDDSGCARFGRAGSSGQVPQNFRSLIVHQHRESTPNPRGSQLWTALISQSELGGDQQGLVRGDTRGRNLITQGLVQGRRRARRRYWLVRSGD